MQSSMERGQVERSRGAWNGVGAVGCLPGWGAVGLPGRGGRAVGLPGRRADALALLRPEYCPGEGVCCKSGREPGKPRFSLIRTGRRRCWMRASCIFLTTENNAATGVLQRCFRSKACLAPELLPLRGGCRRFGSRLSRRIPGRQILSSSTVKCRRIGASNVMR